MTDLALSQAIADGDRLCTHRGVDYVRVAAVFALPIDPAQPPSFYALERDWPATPIGEIAARERTIVSLQRQVAELQAELAAAKAVPPPIALAATGMPDPAPSAIEPSAPPAELPCPECDRTFPGARSLHMHQIRVHKGSTWSTKPAAEPEPTTEPEPAAPEPPPPPARAPIPIVPDDPTWSCRSCGKRPGVDGAFSRSVQHPELCFKCAATANSARPTTAQIAA